MHKYTLSIFLAFSFIILGGISSASAQLAYGSAIKADIPYDFMVMDKSYPAGEYSFSRTLSNVVSPSILIMRGTSGKAAIFDTIGDLSRDGYADTTIVLDSVDGQYFLSKITLQGELRGYAIAKSKAQKQSMANVIESRQVVITGTGY